MKQKQRIKSWMEPDEDEVCTQTMKCSGKTLPPMAGKGINLSNPEIKKQLLEIPIFDGFEPINKREKIKTLYKRMHGGAGLKYQKITKEEALLLESLDDKLADGIPIDLPPTDAE